MAEFVADKDFYIRYEFLNIGNYITEQMPENIKTVFLFGESLLQRLMKLLYFS